MEIITRMSPCPVHVNNKVEFIQCHTTYKRTF